MRQRGFRTRLPNIYQPHDLQHVHHPEFFDLPTRVYRQLGYRAMARQASRVSVMTSHGVEDVVRHLRVPQDRVMVVPWASLLGLYGSGQAEAPEAPADLGVPGRYLLFPAQTWPHKNHLRLLAALARLRDRGIDVPLVLTGRRNQHWARIEEEIDRLRLQDLVVPLDFVSVATLQRLYQEAVGVVFPTLFEGWGLPVVEAMDVGTPVACSAISPLREIAAGAALLFDPMDVASIETSVEQLWTDQATRARLKEACRQRGQDFSWAATARLFRAHYRSVLRLPPTEEDQALLAAPSVV
jgi:glycosyltransferase involved in cell wall biosynthesis